MSALDRKLRETVAESLGVSSGNCLERVHRALLTVESERNGNLQGVTIYRTGAVRATYVWHTLEFKSLADLAAWAEK